MSTSTETKELIARVRTLANAYAADAAGLARMDYRAVIQQRADDLSALCDRLNSCVECPQKPSADKPVGEWRAMETAPKDGSPFLATLLVYDRRTDESEWQTNIIRWDDATGALDQNFYDGWDWDDYTNWQPSPRTPTQSQSVKP